MSARSKKLVFWVLALAAIAYVNHRAATLAFTYDESWTFNAYATADWYSTLWNLDPSANNHILHSLLMRLSWLAFGQEEYFLRLPVVLAHIGYVFITYKICIKYLPSLWISAFFLLNFQPYLLDYFVAARGYGMAIFFTVAALYLLLEYYRKEKQSLLLLSSLSAFFAVWSNFTYLLILVTFIFLALLLVFKRRHPKHAIVMLPAILAAIWFFVNPVKRLISAGEIYYGGESGFITDTVHSLSKQMLYANSDSGWLIGIYPVLVLGSLIAGLWYFLNNKRDVRKLELLLLPGLFLILPAIGSVLLNWFFDKPYLLDRTALFMLPLSLIQLLFCIQYFKGEMNFKIFSNYFTNLLSLALVALLCFSLNFTHLVDFKEHSDTRQALLDLQEQKELDNISGFRLGQSTYMNATINFYWTKYGLTFMNRGDLTFCNDKGPYPYYYLFGVDKDCLNNVDVELLNYYPVSDTYLYRHNKHNN